jgi:hypothetical protein
MAEQSNVHLWVNTIIAVLALAVSGAIGYVQWNNYLRKSETVSFFSAPKSDCPLRLGSGLIDQSQKATAAAMQIAEK